MDDRHDSMKLPALRCTECDYTVYASTPDRLVGEHCSRSACTGSWKRSPQHDLQAIEPTLKPASPAK